MRFLLLVLSVLCTSAFANSVSNSDQQLAAVEKAVNYYLEGSILGDPKVIAKAFHPDAIIQGISGGKHRVYQLKEFLGVFTPGKPGTHTTKIISIDIVNNAASVRAEWDMGTWKYIDFLSLLKMGDEWKVVNKIYTSVKK
ncbi:nuclear transport factor 2 family protein [Thalassotalea ganghwensis]